MKQIGTQVYGLSKETKDCKEVYHALRDIGFTSIEPLVVPARVPGVPLFFTEEDLYEQVKIIRNLGMSVTSAHIPLHIDSPKPFSLSLEDLLRISDRSDIRYLVFSGMIQDKEEAKKWSKLIHPLIDPLKQNGVTLVYHNHGMEFTLVDDEYTALDCLFALCDSRLALQLDIGWAAFGSGNECAILKQYRHRIVSIHLKDFTADGIALAGHAELLEDKHFAIIGEGVVKTKEILQNLVGCPLMPNAIIIDQDASTKPMLQALKEGYDNLLQLI